MKTITITLEDALVSEFENNPKFWIVTQDPIYKPPMTKTIHDFLSETINEVRRIEKVQETIEVHENDIIIGEK
jgi:hypothetical protein